MKTNFWVTGASSGIGREIALQLASAGHHVVISARRASELEALRDGSAHPERFTVQALDLAHSDEFDQTVAKVEEAVGPIYGMVHCGGISQRARAIDTTAQVDRTMMEVNYFGTVALTRALLPRFIERKSGHFVVITSLMGVFSSPMRSSYCAAKHALHGYFDALRAEVHDANIGVTLVCPGFISTDISRNALVGDGSKQGTMDEATGKGMTAAECARRIIAAVNKRKPEVYIGGKEILGIYLKRYFPGILRRVIRRTKVT